MKISSYLLCASAIASTLWFSACSAGSGSSDIVTIDLASNVGTADNGSLNDLFEVDFFIRPELTDSTLLSDAPVHGRHGNRLYIQEDNERLYTFDVTDGRALSSFSRVGNGPEDWNSLYFAYPAKNGDWVAQDTRGRKVVRYTADGAFVGSYSLNTDNICPNGDGWAGPKDVWDGEKQVIYLFDDSFNLTDSIPTDLTRRFMVVNLMTPTEGRASMVANDTLYVVSDSRTFAPEMAFTLGEYALPYYSEDEFDKFIAEHHRYVRYQANIVDNLVVVDYNYDKKSTLQIYNRADGKLIYSYTVAPEEYKGYTRGGFPFEIDGKEYGITPMGIADDGVMFFIIQTEQFGEEEGNPAILGLRPKK
ncbi:MAG: 6-bladed beta-propeller [Muribaculaceae bacterium]|nr:6-bladed beta-propeller [Muribaculaceae bacterium]